MAYVIKDECIACGACIEECPVEAIVAGDDQYTIDADKCIDCGACVSKCPRHIIWSARTQDGRLTISREMLEKPQ